MLADDYQVHETVDGTDGWQQLQQNEAISVASADMQKPDMSGMDLLVNLRNSGDERLAALPVIEITGVGDTEEAKRTVFDDGATDFSAKPFESIDLLNRAKSCARQNRQLVELEKESGHDKLTGLFCVAGYREQDESALQAALACSNRQKIAGFFEQEDVAEQKSVYTGEDMRMAFQPVLDGSNFRVPDHVLQAVEEKLNPFLDYVANRLDTGRTDTDGS